MVIGRLTGYLALGLVGAFLLNALIRPGQAIGTGAALTETGIGISSIGQGIGDSLRSIGSGSAKLLDPLFSLKDLIYDAQVSGAANVGSVSQVQAPRSSSTITWSGGTTRTVPSLSPAAKSYYSARGVSVT